MTIINPKSIAGVTSITTASGADNLLTVHTNNTTERVRINNDGDVIVGSGITVSPDGDIFATGVTTATTFSGSGASLTNLPAANITGTLPAISAANLTNIPAANITGTLPAISGANLTNLDASDLASGTVPTARLGSGTASSSTFLRGDSTFATVTSVGGATGVDFNDDVKARFGTGNDIEIFHSSDQSYIRNSTGNLRIEADALRLRSKTDTENYIKADLNGAVELYHDNSKKLETTSSGVNITGGLNLTDHLTLDDTDKIKLGDSDDLQIDHSGTNSQIYHDGTGHLYIATLGSGEDLILQAKNELKLSTADSERLRITSDGKIGINETSPSYRLHVRENSDTDYAINTATVNSALMLENENTGNSKNIGIYFGGAYSNGEGYITMVADGGSGGDFRFALRSGGSRTDRMTITNDSTINGDFNDTSDINLKENIVSMSSTIDKVKQLRPVTFDWKESYRPNNVSGFIAQEVKTIYPDLVRGVEWTADDPGKHYTINTMGVVAHLTKALQESITKIEVLETRLNNAGIAT